MQFCMSWTLKAGLLCSKIFMNFTSSLFIKCFLQYSITAYPVFSQLTFLLLLGVLQAAMKNYPAFNIKVYPLQHANSMQQNIVSQLPISNCLTSKILSVDLQSITDSLSTAVRWGLTKNLTAQDTHFSPITSKFNWTLSSHDTGRRTSYPNPLLGDKV